MGDSPDKKSSDDIPTAFVPLPPGAWGPLDPAPLGTPGSLGLSAVSGARRRRTAPAILVLAALASLTTGCSGDAARCGPAPAGEVSQADLYGSYTGPNGARLTLTVKNWPKENAVEILKKGAPAFDGRGYWEMPNPPGKDAEIELQFEDLYGRRGGPPVDQLQVGRSDGHTVLFAKLGDPDVCRVFKLTS
ncbi:hypothetical protein ABCR94_06610 [Streptomyces sp. 21So2-11]|uniref:hypothetical protein n=1 Tax=Streptomyces sp. 21So2-11 TaxID=3144408 RepID=UPI00321B8C55